MSKTRYRRRDDVLFSDIGDDIVALSVERGQCYGMEQVSAAVWGMLAEPLNHDQICEKLLELYEVDLGQCRVEVAGLLEQFRREGLVTASHS